MPSRLLVGVAVAFALLLSMQRWRLAVKTSLVLLVIEGALRKWVVPGAQDVVYFAKDLLLIGAYIGFFQDSTRNQYAGPNLRIPTAATLLGALYGLVEVFNPELPTPLIGVLGWKAYFLYTPLLWVLPATFRTDQELWDFLRKYVLLALPIGLLGALQFRAPVDSALNAYARGGADADIATFGAAGRARVTGTFSYISGFAIYLQATAILVLALIATRNWLLKQNKLLLATLVATILGMFSTGSRGPVLMLILLFPIYVGISVLRERGGSSTFIRLAVTAAALAILLGMIGDEAITAFKERAEGSSDVQGRIFEPFVAPARVLPQVGLFGYGIGATHQAAQNLGGNEMLLLRMRMPAVEVESGRVVIETGFLGFVLIYLPRLYLIVYGARQIPRMRTLFHRALVTSSLLFMLTQLTGAVIFEVTTGFYYWFFAGLLMLVVRLDSETTVPAEATVVRPHAPRGRAFA